MAVLHVVWSREGWFLLDSRSTAVSFDSIVDVLDADRQVPDAPSSFVDRFAEVPDPSDVLEGVWMWIGSVSHGRVEVERHDGERVFLDDIDLRLLDQLRVPAGAGDVVERVASRVAPRCSERELYLRLGQLRSARRLVRNASTVAGTATRAEDASS